MLHPRVYSNAMAQQLGLMSLQKRYSQDRKFAKDIKCPRGKLVDQICTAAESDQKLTSVFCQAMLELADALDSSALEIAFDPSTYSTRNLLQPSLQSAQGPAILVRFEGVALSCKQVEELFNSSASVVDSSLPSSAAATREQTPTAHALHGLGLTGCFALGDVVSVLSGDSLYIFDPKSVCLGTLKAKKHTSTQDPEPAKGVAKAFRFTEESMALHFSGQFVPFSAAFDVSLDQAVPHTIIRVPLRHRHKATLLGPGDPVGTKAKFAQPFEELSQQVIFARKLRTVVFLLIEPEASVTKQTQSASPDLAASRKPKSASPDLDASSETQSATGRSRSTMLLCAKSSLSDEQFQRIESNQGHRDAKRSAKRPCTCLDISVRRTCYQGPDMDQHWCLSFHHAETRLSSLPGHEELPSTLVAVAALTTTAHQAHVPIDGQIFNGSVFQANTNLPVNIFAPGLQNSRNFDVRAVRQHHAIHQWNAQLLSSIRYPYQHLIGTLMKRQATPSLDAYNYWPRIDSVSVSDTILATMSRELYGNLATSPVRSSASCPLSFVFVFTSQQA
jgi:hypothetical protein